MEEAIARYVEKVLAVVMKRVMTRTPTSLTCVSVVPPKFHIK